MQASNLKLEELIEFTDGSLNLHGRRLVLHDIHAFAQFRKDLMDTIGLEQTRRILTRFGYFMGQADAAAMNRIFKWRSLKEWIKAGPRFHTLKGVAKNVIKILEVDEERKSFHMELVWHKSGEAEEHLDVLDKSDAPVCWMLVGYASGYASYCLGKNVYFIEDKCRAKGDRVCTAVGKDEDSWDDRIKDYLPYFQADDIQGKIKKLTAELRRKSRELSRQRKKIALLEQSTNTFFVEVRSPAFLRVLDVAKRVARFDSSVLVTGESGTGKEVLTRFIHHLSHRADNPFLAVNCGGLSETLLESELFGHKRGSFTGAIENRVGLFEQANKGTIFLDEIGDVSLAMQIKLLRVLQEREIMRVGESQTRKIDVRIIAATNRNLSRLIREGKFREDLYYRLGVIEIEIPPLRDRKEDIIPLIRYFVKKFTKTLNVSQLRLDATCLDYLQAYSWPGNVRELENTIERAAVLCEGGHILPMHFPPNIVHANESGELLTNSANRTLAEVEFSHIRNVLQSTGENKTKAASVLGISQATLWRKLKQMPLPSKRSL